MLIIKNLNKSFFKRNHGNGTKEPFHALKDISFQIGKNELVGVVGLSGSGKTTLLRCILQLTRPDAGSVYYKEENLVPMEEEQLRRQVRPFLRKLYQHPESALNPGLTVRKILAQPMKLYHPERSAGEVDREVRQLLNDVGLPAGYLSKYPHQLSGGEKRRVALARALATDPEILFADEPFAGLDKALQYQMLKLILGIMKERGLSVVMVSHDIDIIRHVCDRIITLKDGRIMDIAGRTMNGVEVKMDHFQQSHLSNHHLL